MENLFLDVSGKNSFADFQFVAAPAYSGIVPEPFCKTEKLKNYGESLPGCLWMSVLHKLYLYYL